ncbi:MAG TPA: pitrilysin family protein [Phycisphaerae bacterium]|nr:pitrilysin family protein [Phycisphaerae bacterium]HOM51729.1 pitrilysin family protein [Phycisphaerae bacterium]HON67619.1 pitrilysin family protein [Phycisphaerae bacterium]HOQ86947.1 pitrilysin family protein [Phycisphaerae bacterium]HPP28764.1 pitrilysin family protein [Phycisphaerae bacterium]
MSVTSPFVVEQLSNGLTVVIEVMPHVQSAACGFLARTGARDDPPELAGVSHFLEHMMFKGTALRTWEQVNVEFDEMGSYYNAYTSKDRTFYYGWVQTGDLQRQLELLADMMRSTLPQDQFDMEKNVVLEEIAMSRDDLGSVAYDYLHEQLYAGTPLAWPVLGWERTIKDMTREGMWEYFTRRYAPNNLILVVAGNVEPTDVLRMAQRACGDWPHVDSLGTDRRSPPFRTGVATQQVDRFRQQAVLLAFPSVGATDSLYETAEATAAILGGENSRFYWNIVQKGISPRAGAFHEEYQDFGMIVLFGLCEPENCEKLLDAMREEAARLAADGPQEKELRRVKNLRRTSLANESEAPFYRLGQLADDMDYRGRPRPAEDRLAAVDAVSAESVAEYLRRWPITGPGYLVSVGPRVWPA